MKNICVFCSSSDILDKSYNEEAKQLGKGMAERGYDLVYGGGTRGLMGIVAKTIHEQGGNIVSIIPKAIRDHIDVLDIVHEEIITKDIRERKATMDTRSDAFIALPGGFGTLEEVIEVFVLKQLNFHTRPIIFINTNGYYDDLRSFFQRMYQDNFAKDNCEKLYYFADNAEDALDYITTYKPPHIEHKWFNKPNTDV